MLTAALNRMLSDQLRQGLSTIELERLAAIYGLFPDNADLTALILKLNVYPETNVQIVEHLLERATFAAQSRPDIKLMRLFYLGKSGSSLFSLNLYRDIEFTKIRHDLVLLDIWRICTIKCIVELPEYYTDFCLDDFIAYVSVETDPNVLYSVLYALSNQHALSIELSVVADALSQVTFDKSVECFAVTYFFLTSFGFGAQAKRLEKSYKQQLDAATHPLYIKAMAAPQDVSFSTSPPQNFEPFGSLNLRIDWIWKDTALQALEIKTRLDKHARSAPSFPSGIKNRKHLLVAFFGQMRFADATLSAISEWVLRDFEEDDVDVKITFGISTWKRTGAKIFLLNDHIDTIAGFLPGVVLRALKDYGCCTLSDVAVICPRVVRKILESNDSKSEVDFGHLKSMLVNEVYTTVSDECEFMSALGGDISSSCDADTHLLNQGRMITRIGAVRDILADVDREQGVVTHVLFIRPDLCDLSGSIASVFRQMDGQTNWAVVDEDFYAQVVEGVGDRYILCDRPAANTILNIDKKTADVFSGNSPELNLYKQRLLPHRMLRTVLFEGCVHTYTVSRSAIGWNLFRGNLTALMLEPELSADANEIKDLHLRTEILAGISSLRN
ncbi:hypothetical protein [Methylobacterium sp. WL18]|uniref:hypothetical protein n=1 Tax=Methylobacterium sp. WL18 TaxID=2603897 RepID=UPI0011C94189|nr:hypothetical protein [Methylobacterium sp. WL18]